MSLNNNLIFRRAETTIATTLEFNKSSPLITAMMQQFSQITYKGKNISEYDCFIAGPGGRRTNEGPLEPVGGKMRFNGNQSNTSSTFFMAKLPKYGLG